MLHLIIGIVAILIGLIGIMRHWYMFVDVLAAVIPLALIIFGIVALLAGIRRMQNKPNEESKKGGS